MKQPAIVHNVEDDGSVLVRYPDPKTGKSTASRSFWGVKEKSFPVSNSRSFPLREGDMVEIFVDPAGAVKAAFMIFIFPLLCFLLAYRLAGRVFSSEILPFFIGCGGLVAGIAVNGVFRKIIGPGKKPSIERVLTQADIDKWKSCNSACDSCKGCG